MRGILLQLITSLLASIGFFAFQVWRGNALKVTFSADVKDLSSQTPLTSLLLSYEFIQQDFL